MNENVYEVSLDRTATVPIAEGVHLFRIKAIEEGESRSDNPMWTVRMVCLTPSEEGKELSTWLVLTEAARWRFEQFLDAVNAPSEGVAVASQFVGKVLQVQVKHEEYNSKMQATAGALMPAPANNARPAGAAPSAARTPAPARPAAAPSGTPAKATVKPGAPVRRGLPADVKGSKKK